MSNTSSQYEYLEPTGVIVPDTSATLTEVQLEFQQAFGVDLIVTPDTPQGVLITGEAIARDNVINNNAALANQINPNVAGGTFLDAILALMGVQRNAQQPTVVSGVTVTGVVGTVIPIGAQAQTAAGDIFQITSATTIPSGGTTTANFQSVEYGPIPCAINALNEILTGIIGWESVNNSAAGVIGSTTQSDQAARAYRLNTLAFQGLSLAAAITSALYAVPGVTSLFFQENTAGTTETINGISMISHSIYACVEGGTDLAVASAILENKGSGAGMNGGTSVSVIEPASGQTYTVLFDRPTPVPLLIKVTTTNGSETAITQAILDYAAGLIQVTDQNGTSGSLPGFVVGGDVSPFDIAGAILAENPGTYLSNVQLTTVAIDDYTNTPVPIAVNEIATITEGDITVIIS